MLARCLPALLLIAAAGCDDGGADRPAPDNADTDPGERVLADAAPPDGACVAAEERCNGVDDDCDGRVDEGFPGLGMPCHTGNGACRGFGEVACTADGAAACDAVAREPEEEICDGLDNDCDGRADEGINFTRDPQNCGGCGRVCAFDNATAVCVDSVCEVEACLEGFGDANAAAFDGCECAITLGGVEACDGVDQDCDGRVDEGFALGIPCVSGRGACLARGESVCGDDGALACGAVPGEPAAEICNGVDDDCDGAIDEDFDADGDGAPHCPDLDCAGPCPAGFDCAIACARQDCDDADPARSPRLAEICEDGVDQNCDGADAPCVAPAGRVNLLEIANLAPQCRDFDGDGQPDNAFARIAPLANGQLAAAIRDYQLNLVATAMGLVPPGQDGRFDLAVVVGLRVNNRTFDLAAASLDDDGVPKMLFPAATVAGGQVSAGPGDFLLGLPVPGGQPGDLRVRDTLVHATITVDDRGLTVREGWMAGVVTEEDLQATLAALPPEVGIITMLLQADVDLDDEPGPDAYSACIRFTTTPVELRGFTPP